MREMDAAMRSDRQVDLVTLKEANDKMREQVERIATREEELTKMIAALTTRLQTVEKRPPPATTR